MIREISALWPLIMVQRLACSASKLCALRLVRVNLRIKFFLTKLGTVVRRCAMETPYVIGFAIVQGVGKRSIMVVQARRVYVARRTKFQEVIIADLEDFGKSLVLDGYIQSSLVDEYMYHESLVHPAMSIHPNPRRVLIVGGGEGATLREVLKHSTVEEAVMVDIDEEVVKLSKEYLKEMHQGAFDDPRARVVIEDGKKFLAETDRKFDVVILDLTDPYSSEIARELYTEEFYRLVASKMNTPGVMVTQAGNSFFFEDIYEDIVKAVKRVFDYVVEYGSWIPSFGYICNFVLGSKGINPYAFDDSKVDKVLEQRGVKTKYFNGKVYLSMLYSPIIERSGVKFNEIKK